MSTLREFIREFPRFKRLAEAGKTVTLVDRKGRRFTFAAEKAKKPKSFLGAAKHMSTGVPLSPDPIPKDEWKGNY